MPIQTLADIRQEAQTTQRLWAKVLGMLQQNWCIIEPTGDAAVELVFFDDHGEVFDCLSQPHRASAEAALSANGFFWLHETPSALHFMGLPPLPSPHKRERSRPVYSSGQHWTDAPPNAKHHSAHATPTRQPADALERFIDAQDPCWYEVVEQLAAGEKISHWMWFIFPQRRGLGQSHLSQYFGLAGISETARYSQHEVLGARLQTCIELLLDLPVGTRIERVLGPVDAMKLRSCMTLFETAARFTPNECGEVLERFFGGERCGQTIQALNVRTR